MNSSEIATSLSNLAIYLNNWNGGKNVKNENILHTIMTPEKSSFQLSIQRANPIIFRNVHVGTHAIPKGLEKLDASDSNVTVGLTIELEADYSNSNINFIKRLGINFLIQGSYGFRELVSAWHLDLDTSSNPKVTHPLFHLNFGGMQMKRSEFFQLIALDSPRIVHHPMDVILAVDFILRNFYKKDQHEQITSLPTYKKILQQSCETYLIPYYNNIMSNLFKTSSICQTVPSLNF